jgi:hypothetical protein
MRKNLLCMRLGLPTNARLWRQRLVTVTNKAAVTTGTTTATKTTLARHLHCPTSTSLRTRYGTTSVYVVPVVAPGTSALSIPLPTGRLPALAPQSGSQKPCISSDYSTQPSLLPAHAYDYYTITARSSPALLTPPKTGPHVFVPARVSNYNANSSSPSLLTLRNLNVFQVQSSLFHQPASLRSFSMSTSTMTAIKLDGTAIAKSIREKLAAEVVEKQKLNPQYQPCLKIIQG